MLIQQNAHCILPAKCINLSGSKLCLRDTQSGQAGRPQGRLHLHTHHATAEEVGVFTEENTCHNPLSKQ